MISKNEALKQLLIGRALLFCHHNADPDTVCSAYAVKELAEALNTSTKAEIILTGGASRLSKRVIDALDIETTNKVALDEADVLVILDTATLRQLEGVGPAIASAKAPKVFIDHHAPHPETAQLAVLYLVDEKSTSTCEVVYELYRSYGISPSATVAKALLTGIAYDSKHFAIGTGRTFRAVAELLEVNGDMDEIIGLLSSKMDRSEKVARLKAAQRMRIHDVGGWSVVTTHVSSFQASAARSLISLGADVAIVVGHEKGEVKASLRSTQSFHDLTKIHLGRDIAMPLGEEFGGAGSGHSSSAGVNAHGETEPFCRRAVELISLALRP